MKPKRKVVTYQTTVVSSACCCLLKRQEVSMVNPMTKHEADSPASQTPSEQMFFTDRMCVPACVRVCVRVCACVLTWLPLGTYSCALGPGSLCRILQLQECYQSVNVHCTPLRSYPVQSASIFSQSFFILYLTQHNLIHDRSTPAPTKVFFFNELAPHVHNFCREKER